jgi:hypothetical protein
MATTTPNLIDNIKAWIVDTPNIKFAPSVNGGWERWAQVDFNCWLNSKKRVETILEDLCFKDSSQRADLTIAGKSVVEFKTFNCRTEYVGAYIEKIYMDYKKLSENKLEDKYANYSKWAIGLSTLQNIVESEGCKYPNETEQAMGIFRMRQGDYKHEKVDLGLGLVFVITYIQL